MKKLIYVIIILLKASMALSNSDWDLLIWNQDNWYKEQNFVIGQVITHVIGNKTGISNAQISIVELGMEVNSDINGDFILKNVPDGSFTIIVDTEYFLPIQLSNVLVKNGQANLQQINLFEQKNRYSQDQVDTLLYEERKKWDVDNDGQIGLKEAIRALSTSAGFIK